MNTATSKNACIETNLVVKCILECGFTQILQLYLGCHVWGCCVQTVKMSSGFRSNKCADDYSHTVHTVYAASQRLPAACREKMGVCEEIKRDTDLHTIIWFALIVLFLSSFLKKQRVSCEHRHLSVVALFAS